MKYKDDLSLLQGSWLQFGYERDGIIGPIDNEQGWQPLTDISDSNFTVTISDGNTILTGEFTLDQTQQPKEIDWIDTGGSYASQHTIQAIYTLTETEFVFCASYNGEKRPTDFTTKPGQVLRRMRRL